MQLTGQCCPGILADGSIGHFGCCDNTESPTERPSAAPTQEPTASPSALTAPTPAPSLAPSAPQPTGKPTSEDEAPWSEAYASSTGVLAALCAILGALVFGVLWWGCRQRKERERVAQEVVRLSARGPPRRARGRRGRAVRR